MTSALVASSGLNTVDVSGRVFGSRLKSALRERRRKKRTALAVQKDCGRRAGLRGRRGQRRGERDNFSEIYLM
jgi:hypothetical protein